MNAKREVERMDVTTGLWRRWLVILPLLFSISIFTEGCVSSINSRPVRTTPEGGVEVAEGAVYQLPANSLEVKGSYRIVKVTKTTTTIQADGQPKADKEDYYFVRPSPASEWSVSIAKFADSNLAYSVDPGADRKANIAFADANDANQISIADDGLLTAVNYSPDDKSLTVLLNTVKAVTNVASLMALPGGAPMLRLAAPGAGVVTYQDTELAKIEAKIAKDVDAVIDRGDVLLSEFSAQVEGSSQLEELFVTGKADRDKFKAQGVAQKIPAPLLKVASKSGKKCTSNSVRTAILALDTRKNKKKGEIPVIQGVVARYAGGATVELRLSNFKSDSSSTTGETVFLANTQLFEAGGVHRIKLKSQVFGKSTDKLTFSQTTGKLTKWAYGRDSSAEKLSGAAVELTAATGDALATVEKTNAARQKAEETQRAADEVKINNRTTKEKAVVTAEAAFANAKAVFEAAEQKYQAAPNEAARQEFVKAEANFKLAKLDLDQAKQLRDLAN